MPTGDVEGSLEHGVKVTDQVSPFCDVRVLSDQRSLFHLSQSEIKTQDHCHYVSESEIKITQAFHRTSVIKLEYKGASIVFWRKNGAGKGLGPVC